MPLHVVNTLQSLCRLRKMSLTIGACSGCVQILTFAEVSPFQPLSGTV